MTETKPTEVIILNRMYVGDYLGDNIGHEVINLMKPDKGKYNYVYLNARGDLNKKFIEKNWEAKTILLTRWCTREYTENKKTRTQSMLEVLAKVTDIKPWTLSDTIKKNQKLIKTIIKDDYDIYNKDFGSNIFPEYEDICDIPAIEKQYDKILTSLKDGKYKNTPKQICNIDKIEDKDVKEKLKKNDKDNTGKYKRVNKTEVACTQDDINSYKKYIRDKEKYYDEPLQKLMHELQVRSLEKVMYGGKSLVEIFSKNIRNERALYVTFSAKNIIEVKRGYHIYLVDKISQENKKKIEEEPNTKVIEVNKEAKDKIQFAASKLRQYITNGKHDKKDLTKVYENINNEIKKDYWAKEQPLKYQKRIKLGKDNPLFINTNPQKANFINIIRQEYDELTYTNLFAYIFKNNPKLFYKFAIDNKNGLNICKKNLSKDCKETVFLREDGNIDLLIDDKEKKTLIVIENKIKSGINGIRHNELEEDCGNQLSKYIHYTYGYKVKRKKDKNKYEYEKFSESEKEIKPYDDYKNREFFIFAPKYKNFDIKEINQWMKKKAHFEKEEFKHNYQLITYDKIYKFFTNKFYQNIEMPYLKEFLYAIALHKDEVDNIQERQMFERFADRIRELTPDKQ